ncbi:restriction endonuclease subunit S [Prevotella merdae]|uniref:restriction endonuclease subunit S n=1 Tax=Prevotella merdae TaxID=2079531 RepID=UPI00402661DF
MKCIDEEIPFEVPKGWEWCRLSALTTRFSTGPFGTMLHKEDYTDNGVAVINPTNIINHKISLNNIKQISLAKAKELQGYAVCKGDIILARRGDLRKSAIITDFEDSCIAGTGSFIFHLLGIVNSFFILFYSSPYVQDYLITDSIGTTMNNLNQKLLSRLLIPIPPRVEQVRIVSLVDELFSLVNTYDMMKNKLDFLNSSLHENIKKSILQEAIQGKLVPQIAEEGTAQELLEQIKTEKQKLVKEGKLKKSALNDSVIFRGDDNKYYEQTGSEVTEIELPFDFPSTWSISRLNVVCQLTDGLKTTGKQCLLDAKYLRGKSSETIVEQGKLVYKGDNIMLVDGENSGEVFIVPQDGYMGSTFKQLWISSSMYEPYVLAFLQFYKETLRNSKKGTVIPHLNKELFYGLIIGIPPLQEQRRVVQKIEQSSKLLK